MFHKSVAPLFKIPQQHIHLHWGWKNSTIETTTIPVNRNVFHTPHSSSIPNTPVTAPPTLPITSSIDISEHNITYYKVEVPHPDLLYDFDTHRFSAPFFKDGKNSLEAIFHFYCSIKIL